MMKSCSWCGRMHQKNEICPRKPTRKKFNITEADRFRRNSAWRRKSIEIRTRDKGLCQICIRNLYNTVQQYTFDTVGVHHIVPLNEDLSKGLDNENLLSVCEYHHKMCESGEIPRDEQRKLAREQVERNSGW